jgi:uroporphyrinogen decarboxylase
MTSRERVINTLKFKESDRIPMNFSCSENFQKKLCEYFNIKENKMISNPLVNSVNPDILEKLNCDFRAVSPVYQGTEHFLLNLFPDNHIDCEILKKADLTEVASYRWPDPDWFDYSTVTEQCEEYKDYCIITGNPGTGDFLYKAGSLYGMEDMYMGLIKHDPVLIKIFEKISDFYYEYNRRIFEAGKGMIDIAFYGDDYGGYSGSLIGEKTFRDILKPYWDRHFTLVKSYGLKIMFHSCGSIKNLLPVLHETGVDIIDPLQTDIRDINLEELKKKFYGKIAFHGGICLEKSYKNTDEIRKEVRRVLSVMSDGGGYIMAPTTIVTENIPVEYVISMYEEGFNWK